VNSSSPFPFSADYIAYCGVVSSSGRRALSMRTRSACCARLPFLAWAR
jgi:hypothetical protein